MGEVFASFAEAIGAGVMMVYALLVLLFGSFLQPITILVSLPLSMGGAIGALLLTHKAMSMPVVIGILMLMGIVTKNAIMLVDFALEEIGARHAAARGAGRSRTQARAADRHDDDRHGRGHVPSALGLGDGGELPLADGDCGDGRPGGVDLAVARLRARRLHADRRSRPADLARLRPLRRRSGRGRAPASRRAPARNRPVRDAGRGESESFRRRAASALERRRQPPPPRLRAVPLRAKRGGG